MATTTQIALSARATSLIVLWHLLSLDAPTVAALWLWFIARSSHISLPTAVPVAMAIAVWMLYVADRLLDAARGGAAHELEARHIFHHHHRREFLYGIALGSAVLAVLLHNLDPAAIRLYLVEGIMLFAWFVLLHATHSAYRLPKEIAVGLFFSAAIFIPTFAREPGLRAPLLPIAIVFAALCSLNCLFIYAWEHDRPEYPTVHPAHVTTRVAVAHLPALASATAIGSSVLALFGSAPVKPIAVACALSAGVLLALHRNRCRLSRNGLRAAADMALLTPILLLPFLR